MLFQQICLIFTVDCLEFNHNLFVSTIHNEIELPQLTSTGTTLKRTKFSLKAQFYLLLGLQKGESGV
jgi:hypothetical protein